MSKKSQSRLFTNFLISGFRAGSRIGTLPIFIVEIVAKIPLLLLKLIITAPGWLFEQHDVKSSSAVLKFRSIVGLEASQSENRTEGVVYDGAQSNWVFFALNIVHAAVFYPIHIGFKLLELVVGVLCGAVGLVLASVFGSLAKLAQVVYWHGIKAVSGKEPEYCYTEAERISELGKELKNNTIATYDTGFFLFKLPDVALKVKDDGFELEGKTTAFLNLTPRGLEYLITAYAAPCLSYPITEGDDQLNNTGVNSGNSDSDNSLFIEPVSDDEHEHNSDDDEDLGIPLCQIKVTPRDTSK